MWQVFPNIAIMEPHGRALPWPRRVAATREVQLIVPERHENV